MENAASCVIGLDLGTTTIKAVAFAAADGAVVASAERTLALERDASGAAEQDPAAVARAALDALAEAAREVAARGDHVARVGMSAAMHSLLPVAADGTPLTRAMLWMDERAADAAHALWASREGQALYARTGAPTSAMIPLAKLVWLRERQPDLFARAARFVSLKEWVWHAWLGAWEIDPGIAGATGLYNLRAGGWDAEALALAGVDASRLSALVPAIHTRSAPTPGALAEAGLAGVPFVIGSSDGVLANLGVGASLPGDLVLTIGTSLAVRAGSREPRTDAATRLFCYMLNEGHYVVGGPSNSGGIVLDWLYRQVLRGPDAPVAPGLTTEQPPSGFVALLDAARDAQDPNLLCLPYVAGERAPLWDARASATFHGLRLRHTSAHLLRAAIDGLIHNARWIAEPLLGGPHPPQRVIATGRVLETDWIREEVAAVLGLPVLFPGPVDASALGAAALAQLAAGAWTWDDVAARRYLPAGSVTEPPAAVASYHARYARFRALGAALRAADPPFA
ncbi:MAG TPA: gluconokinase [Ktedonobacterales bacterium]|jgi:gluconokinase